MSALSSQTGSSHTDSKERIALQESIRPVADLEQIGEKEGYVLDEEHLRRTLNISDHAAIKIASDGKTVLIPQPSEDPQDPLNWPSWKKTMVLYIVSLTAFTADYGSSIGGITLLPQASEWHLSPDYVNHATAGNIFILGAGGIVVVWFSAYFGRLPVLVFFQSLNLATSAWSGSATNFESFMTARILHGFFTPVAAADMYFFHQHPRKINVWSAAVIISPYLGPFIACWIVGHTSWRWMYWSLAMLNAVAWLLIVFCMDETFYPRHSSPGQIPIRRSRLLRLLGSEQWKTNLVPNTFWQAGMRSWTAITKLPVLLSFVYYFMTFAWAIAANITMGVFVIPLYNFTFDSLALLYLAPIVGTILGEVAGHWLHDYLGRLYMARHDGRITPEARLIAIWLSTPFYIIGMVVMGYALGRHWHYMAIAVGWALQNFALMVLTTAINSYVLDGYPEGSGEVAALLNAGRAWGGFVAGYVQIVWEKKSGAIVVFGSQAGITAAAFLIVVGLQLYGERLRKWQGPMKFATQ